jgi:type VI secretion system protein ImpC
MNTEAASSANSPAAVAESTGLLDQIVEQSRVAKSGAEHQRAKDIISELAREVMNGTVVVSDNLNRTLDARVAELDRMISEQLSAVMHAPEFQQLESTWRGLHYLCEQTSTGAMMKIKVLNASKKDLNRDFKSALDFDQSTLFKKVYEEEFGTFGGAPFGALLGDYQIGRQPEDMYFVEQMSHVAAAAHAPFISAAAPELMGLESFADLGKPRDLAKVFDTVEYAKWKSLRDSEDGRYVGLTLPRFLGRLPYNPRTAPPSRASTSSRTWTAPTTPSTSGATPPTRSARGSPTPSRTSAGARRSAAWKAAAWSRTCPPIPSAPTTAKWR